MTRSTSHNTVFTQKAGKPTKPTLHRLLRKYPNRCMKKLFYLLVFILYAKITLAGIGTTTTTFVDASRSNRNIPCEVSYPALSNGTNTTMDTGPFGLVIVSHGFAMGTDAYESYANNLVNAGYIVARVNSETGLSPNHTNYAKDIAYIADGFKQLNNSAVSMFYSKLNGKIAALGHSMGGGATLLAHQYTNNVDVFITLAAAETNPSAASAAATLTKPLFCITGSADCITPSASHSLKMYDSSNSVCKIYMDIKDATHCGMADLNVICSTGEACIIGSTYISRSQQHNLIFQPLYAYLNYYLKGNSTAYTDFKNYLSSTDSFSYNMACGS
jgi:dienelactone hydrolase